MIPISHIASSILILRILSFFNSLIPFSLLALLLSMVFSLITDIDFFWARKLNAHKQSYFHAPLFWVLIFAILYVVNIFLQIIPTWILYVFIVQILAHLLFDFITGRTAGVPIFYPFNKKEYSLCLINKSYGNLRRFETVSKKARGFWKYYFKNKKLVVFEVVIILLGVIALFIF